MLSKLKNIVKNEDLLRPAEGHYKYLFPEFDVYLTEYLFYFEKYREDIGIIPNAEAWLMLPFGKFCQNPSWKWRRQSLHLLQKQIRDQHFETALEIGGWNGWLTKYLAKQSDTVIVADYFVKPFDGIGNISDLAPNIIGIQCHVENIAVDFKPKSFDLIVLNHCLSYMENPLDYINGLIPLLKHGGTILSIGSSFYVDPEDKIAANQKADADYQKQYQKPLYIGPVKGYMDANDVLALKYKGFHVKKYLKMWPQHFLAWFNKKRPKYISIMYRDDTG